MAAYDWDTNEDRKFILDAIRDGLRIFNKLFGYHSNSSIAPNYTWHDDVNKVLCENNVRYLQGSTAQRIPGLNGNGVSIKRHYTGQTNKFNQIYFIRNCSFEPSFNPLKDWVHSCLKEIKTAFLWRKPAIISSHRVNYIGFINPENRDQNLGLLKNLLNKIINKWPDVEFMTTDQLGGLIEENE